MIAQGISNVQKYLLTNNIFGVLEQEDEEKEMVEKKMFSPNQEEPTRIKSMRTKKKW